MGYGNNNDGLVDIAFGASTQGRFGVKAIGRAPGSAAIYGSSKQSPSYPSGDTVWAAWFDGYIYSDGYFTKSPKGNVRGGLKGAYRIDNSDTWFVFGQWHSRLLVQSHVRLILIQIIFNLKK